MLDHVGISVADLAKSKYFYEKALRPLSVTLMVEVTAEQTGGAAHAGFGEDGKAYFWIGSGGAGRAPAHCAFTARSRADVDEFYEAAMAAGGRDNGPPGIRSFYHPDYYGAFVLDPDGNNIEAVCHRPSE